MVKRIYNGFFVPLNLWEQRDLTWMEKILLLELSTYPCEAQGLTIRSGAVATALGITKREVEETIKTLLSKGALELQVCPDALVRYVIRLDKDSYKVATTVAMPESTRKVAESIDYEYIIAEWNRINPDLPRIKRLTPQRKRNIYTCLKKNSATVEDMIKVFKIVNVSSFFHKTTDGYNWRCSLDWIIADNRSQFSKILEGNYCSTYQEKQNYESIMNGEEKKDQSELSDYQ